MTNGWIDIKNTDMMLIMGGNPAENHPCGFKWAIEAKVHRNAKTIVVDPRLTRTAANADMYVQIRAGADIAFLGGVINYAIANNRIAKDYLVNYTNASFIIKDGFSLPEDGLFSGFDPEKRCTTRRPGITKKVETWLGNRSWPRLRTRLLLHCHRARRHLHLHSRLRLRSISRCSIRAASFNY